MPNLPEHTPRTIAEKRADAWLWTGLLLGPLAMGINTIVGFTVAHWTTDTAQKKFSFLVSAIDFALCICALLVSAFLYRRYRQANEAFPVDGRRVFMAKLSLLMSLLSLLLVIAGTIALITLNPTD